MADVMGDLGRGLGQGSLKKILSSTIETIEDNKTQVFSIYETARDEVEASKKQLEDLKFQVRQTVDRVDALEKQEQQAKQKLARVSADFKNSSEERIRQCYDEVRDVQVALAVERDKEKRLREQRDKLEIRLRHLSVMLQQAEHLTLAIGSVLNYLSTQVTGVVWQIEKVQKDKLVGARIIKAVEDERYRMSRELHDGPAQDLANLIFQTSICEKLVDFKPEEAKQNLQEMRQQVRDCLSSVRQVIFDMRPMALDDLGLEAALHQLVAKMATRGVVAAEYQLDGDPVRLSKYVEVAAFRIVQEALNNVAHHSGQKNASVRVLYTKTALSILVEDQGDGFDMDEFELAQAAAEAQADETDETAMDEAAGEDEAGTPPRETLHFGLTSMKERAKMIGAEFQVTSAPGKGTRVHLRIPYKKEDIAVPQKAAAKKR
ncbi:sensor histidine kinase [Selenomonas sp.]|uniref:sensor histidine kinase n=1 Tax=Selenomonas sp. TaxID=2053611 RepID=UPI0026002D91|nr:sensor histidine kinase [Selenomonas sp.]MCI6085867.1 sensor histidine kinase [Selenomonas sp.]MCI6283870.1 sensor histidine kinase [Selenomonas sp.]MDY3298558.1 sensor histidine kinase [Selenomonas sp.]MDY4415068.1 sensor histidine kinase [Selenomonas sp.]